MKFGFLTLLLATTLQGSGSDWQNVFEHGLDDFKTPHGDWTAVASVSLDEQNPRKLSAKPGNGVYYNGPKGRTNNLFTKKKYGDLEMHIEFLVPKGTNSGIKFHGHYEIQIMDSFGVKDPK